MTQPAKNEKLEAFKEQMIEKHQVALRASMELVKISNGILCELIAEPLHKVMRTIARVVVNSNGAVLTVATAGYGNDAAKIVRSMFEGTVTIAYLRKKPRLVFDYIDYHKVKLWPLQKLHPDRGLGRYFDRRQRAHAQYEIPVRPGVRRDRVHGKPRRQRSRALHQSNGMFGGNIVFSTGDTVEH